MPFRKNIIIASQECNFSGAAMLGVNLAREFKNRGFRLIIICNQGGPLFKSYLKYGFVIPIHSDRLLDLIYWFARKLDYCKVITNTTMAGHNARLAAKYGYQIVSLIHELPGTIKAYGVKKNADNISYYSSKVVFPNRFVRDSFLKKHPISDKKICIKGQGLYKEFGSDCTREKARSIRRRLGIPENHKVVIGVGMGGKRKGVDWFGEVAQKVGQSRRDVLFLWVGDVEDQYRWVARGKRSGIVRLVGSTDDVEDYYRAADLFLMTSREDPFPSVVLEAVYCGLPVIGFQDAGGFQELPGEYVETVPFGDTGAMADRVLATLEDCRRCDFVRENGAGFIRNNYSFANYVSYLLGLFQ